MNIVLLIVLSFAAFAAAAWAVMERSRAHRAELNAATADARAQSAEQRARLLEANGETLKAQAAMSAQAVADVLVKRAGEQFEAQERLAQAKLEAQLKPVADTLAKFEAQAAATEKARAEEAGSLKAQIAQMLTASTATQDEARKLSAA